MNDEELELDLFGNQENEEGDIALDHDISSIMESISRNVRYASTPRNIDASLDLQRTIPTGTTDTIPITITFDESRIRPIEKIREETMHSSPRKLFRHINSSGHRDTILVSKNFEDALGGLRIEDNLDRYKEIVEDAINVINILSSTNDRLYMNFNMTNSALSASKESVRDLNNQLATVKMNFDKLMAFTRK